MIGIRKGIRFPSPKDFSDYCREHVMRPDTEWEILSTGERGMGSKEGKNELSKLFEPPRHGAGPAEKFQLPARLLEELDVGIEGLVSLAATRQTGAGRQNIPGIVRKISESRKNLSSLLKRDIPGEMPEIRVLGECSRSIFSTMEPARKFLSEHLCENLLRNLAINLVNSREREKFDCSLSIAKSLKTGKFFLYDPETCSETNTPVSRIRLSDTATVSQFVHELGHAVENAHPEIQELSKNFFESRTMAEGVSRIEGVFFGKSDHFPRKYCGKMQSGQVNLQTMALEKEPIPTEIFSCGLEMLAEDPLSFYCMDPDYFKFIVFLTGVLGKGEEAYVRG